ncbi:unnamed protein product [Orchesella dallaii]|uniref:Uncharacterized protein n=1 Tax=Orchesella dallaii TaxID=48710 RepID=A0ABP1R367_9HEXA
MRADKRSFSFTWMRGQKNNGDGRAEPASDMTTGNPSQMERSNTTWFMTNVSTSSSSSGVSSMSGSSATSQETEESVKENTSFSRSDNSQGRLRRLGSSFTRFGTKYSIIEDDDETQNCEQQEPTVEEPTVPDVVMNFVEPQPQTIEVTKEPVHFDEDGNFIGRAGKPSVSRRKSCSSSKEAGPTSVKTASFGRKINKTVQDVKASLGNFSQKFRRSTRRRYRMGPGTPLTEVTPTRKILGRTPTKLYSPFGIGLESPAFKTPRRLDRPSTPRLTRRSLVSGLVYSPSNNFRNDLAEARRGMEDFHILARDVTRRSVRF